MRKIILLHIVIILLSISKTGVSQDADAIIQTQDLNIPFLEHLVKKEIDNVRTNLGLTALYNDSILYFAGHDHANYLDKKGILTHYQKSNPKKKTPQLRAELYGAKNYQVGENLVQIQLKNSIDIAGNKVPIFTYQEAAIALRKLWVNSPPHYANIRTTSYEVTAIAIKYNPKTNMLWCVQLFANVNNLYIYESNNAIFPYDNNPPKASLGSIKPTFEKHSKHAYGIKETKKNKICSAVNMSVLNNHALAIHWGNDSLYLGIRKRRLAQVKNLFKNKTDGVSIETVLFKYNYSCNLQDNYVIPTRRNGGCEFDGYITPPMYTDSLLAAIKKEEKRLRKAKKRLHPDEFIYINLGQFPPNARGEKLNFNIIYYSKKRVCKILESQSICGYIMNVPLPKIPIKFEVPESDYKPGVLHETIRFKVYFKKNSIEFDPSVVLQKIEYLKSKNVQVVRASLEAYASVEGSQENNKLLYNKRATSILKHFERYQNDSIQFKIKTTENWKLFYRQIKNTEYSFLSDMDTLSIRDYINKTSNTDAFEPLLSKERYVIVLLYIRPIETKETRAQNAVSEFVDLLVEDNDKWKKKNVERLHKIQNYLFQLVVDGSLGFEEITFPDVENNSLHYNRLLFDYVYAPDPQDDQEFVNELAGLVESESFDPPSLKMNLYLADFNNGSFLRFKTEQSRLKQVTSYLTKQGYGADTLTAFTKRLYHNYINQYYENFGVDRRGYKNVMVAKEYFFKLYDKNMTSYSDDKKFRIAEYYTFMSEPLRAMEILKGLVKKPNFRHEHYQLYVKTYYFLKGKGDDFADYELVITDSAEKLTSEEWCSMFIGSCNISLPVFDSQTIKNLYCLKCQ